MAECNDKKCPVHGELSVRGNIFSGTVVSAKPSKTVVVERSIVSYVPKYERYTKSKSRVSAHNPECMDAKEDDIVKVGETRKLSKTKSFVVLEIVGKKKTIKAEEDTFRDKTRDKKEEKKAEKGKDVEKEVEEKKEETKEKKEVKEEKEEEKVEEEKEEKTEEKK